MFASRLCLACVAASLVLTLGTLTPDWDDLRRSLGMQSALRSRRHCGWIVGVGARHHLCQSAFCRRCSMIALRGRFCAALGRRLWRDRRRAGAGHGVRARFRRLSRTRRTSTSRASAKSSPRPALPAAWSIGCSPAAAPARGSDPHEPRPGSLSRSRIGFVVGVFCAVDPQLDLDLAGVGSSIRSRHLFAANAQTVGAAHARSGARAHHAPGAAGLSGRSSASSFGRSGAC